MSGLTSLSSSLLRNANYRKPMSSHYPKGIIRSSPMTPEHHWTVMSYLVSKDITITQWKYANIDHRYQTMTGQQPLRQEDCLVLSDSHPIVVGRHCQPPTLIRRYSQSNFASTTSTISDHRRPRCSTCIWIMTPTVIWSQKLMIECSINQSINQSSSQFITWTLSKSNQRHWKTRWG